MSYSDVKSLPIKYRRWFIKRLVRHFEEKNSQYEDKNQKSNVSEGMKNLDAYEAMLKGKFK